MVSIVGGFNDTRTGRVMEATEQLCTLYAVGVVSSLTCDEHKLWLYTASTLERDVDSLCKLLWDLMTSGMRESDEQMVVWSYDEQKHAEGRCDGKNNAERWWLR